MVIITPDQVIVFGITASVFLLLIIIYFTRATSKRVLGALVGGIVLGLLNILVDSIAFYNGWWHYPTSTTSYGPLGYYIPTALFYGAGIALIGWRINRRFGLGGLTSFILLFGVYGVIRDFGFTAVTQSSNLIVFGQGSIPVIVDALGWITLISIAQIIMFIIAGPAKKDKLRN